MKLYTKYKIYSAVFATFLIMSSDLYSMQNYPTLIPNGNKNSCLNCHFSSGGGGSRNAFGNAFRSNGFKWSKILAELDSDNDGFTNGQELQDSKAEWVFVFGGQNAFGDPTLVTLPADAGSKPTSVIDSELFSNISNAYPNPILENTTFKISNLSNSKIEVITYDINGNTINTETININSDEFYFNWLRSNQNGKLPNGVYLVDFTLGEFTIRRKVVLN